jgi:hypothetical protein
VEKTIGVSVYVTLDFGKDKEGFVPPYHLEEALKKWVDATLAFGNYKALGQTLEKIAGMQIPEFFTVTVADKTTSKDDAASAGTKKVKTKAA